MRADPVLEYERHRSFAPELPHNVILDDAAGILLLIQPRCRQTAPEFSIGCVWRVVPRNCEVLDEQDCLNLARIHENLPRTLPVGAAFQALMTVLPSTEMDDWEALRENCLDDPVVQAQLASIRAGLPHQDVTTPSGLRAVRTVMTLRLPLEDLEPALREWGQSLLTSPMRSGAVFAAEVLRHKAEAIDRLHGFAGSLETTLQVAGHGYKRFSGTQVGQAVALGLRPCLPLPPVIQPDLPIAEQVIHTEIRNMAGGWRYGYTDPVTSTFHEEERAQVLTLHGAPPKSYPGILCATRAPHDSRPLALWDSWPGAFTVAVNVAVVDNASEETRLRTKRWFASRQRSTENETVVEQLDGMFKQMMLSGESVAWSRVHIVLWGQEQTLRRGLDRIITRAQQFKLQFAPDPPLGSTLMLQCLPLGFDPKRPAEWAVKRARRLPLTIIGQFMPFFGAYRGTATAAIPFLNERGEVVYWHPFDSDTNAHSAWTGTSGAGKTHTTAYIVNHLMALGYTVVIVDPLTRYRHLRATWKGSLLSITFEKPPCFNPFYGDLGPLHVSFISAFLRQLASGGMERLNHEEFSTLSSALSYFAWTWKSSNRGEASLTPFVEEVLETGAFTNDAETQRIGFQIARKLLLFYGRGERRGQYADFVDGPNTFVLDPGLTVIEMGDLDKHDALKGILFFAMVHLMHEHFKDPVRFYRPKFAFLDEVWSFADLRETAQKIDTMVRTGRNDGVSMHFLSQLVNDWKTPMGEVIRGLVGTTFFLKQEPQEVPIVKQLFNMSEPEVDVMQRANKYPSFASAYMRHGAKQGGMVRIISDAYCNAQMSQVPAFAERRAKAIAEAGGDERLALARLVAEDAA